MGNLSNLDEFFWRIKTSTNYFFDEMSTFQIMFTEISNFLVCYFSEVKIVFWRQFNRCHLDNDELKWKLKKKLPLTDAVYPHPLVRSTRCLKKLSLLFGNHDCIYYTNSKTKKESWSSFKSMSSSPYCSLGPFSTEVKKKIIALEKQNEIIDDNGRSDDIIFVIWKIWSGTIYSPLVGFVKGSVTCCSVDHSYDDCDDESKF